MQVPSNEAKEYAVELGDMFAKWFIDQDNKVSWLIIPKQMKDELARPRQTIAESEDEAQIPWKDIPLREPHCPVQVCRRGDALQDNCGGITMQWSQTSKDLIFHDLAINKQSNSCR